MFSMKGCGTGVTMRSGRFFGLRVMVRRDALDAHIVDLARLELRVEDGEIGDVFEDQPLEIGPPP